MEDEEIRIYAKAGNQLRRAACSIAGSQGHLKRGSCAIHCLTRTMADARSPLEVYPIEGIPGIFAAPDFPDGDAEYVIYLNGKCTSSKGVQAFKPALVEVIQKAMQEARNIKMVNGEQELIVVNGEQQLISPSEVLSNVRHYEHQGMVARLMEIVKELTGVGTRKKQKVIPGWFPVFDVPTKYKNAGLSPEEYRARKYRERVQFLNQSELCKVTKAILDLYRDDHSKLEKLERLIIDYLNRVSPSLLLPTAIRGYLAAVKAGVEWQPDAEGSLSGSSEEGAPSSTSEEDEFLDVLLAGFLRPGAEGSLLFAEAGHEDNRTTKRRREDAARSSLVPPEPMDGQLPLAFEGALGRRSPSSAPTPARGFRNAFFLPEPESTDRSDTDEGSDGLRMPAKGELRQEAEGRGQARPVEAQAVARGALKEADQGGSPQENDTKRVGSEESDEEEENGEEEGDDMDSDDKSSDDEGDDDDTPPASGAGGASGANKDNGADAEDRRPGNGGGSGTSDGSSPGFDMQGWADWDGQWTLGRGLELPPISADVTSVQAPVGDACEAAFSRLTLAEVTGGLQPPGVADVCGSPSVPTVLDAGICMAFPASLERSKGPMKQVRARPEGPPWSFANLFGAELSDFVLRMDHEDLLRLGQKLASALPAADRPPSSFGPVPAEESNVDGYGYRVYCRNPESLLLIVLLLLRESDATLTVGPMHVDPIIIYSPPHGEGAQASLFVYTHLRVDDSARFFCLGYMQGSAMERVVQHRGATWHAVGERSGRMCSTCNPRQSLADAREEQLRPTYEGSPSETRAIVLYHEGELRDFEHYNFGADVSLPSLSGSATLRRLFSRARVTNLTATSQVAMRLGDVAALFHLTVKPHHGVLGEGNIISDTDGSVILYRLPVPVDGLLRPAESVKGRRVLIMQNEAAEKVSVWAGSRVQAAKDSSVGDGTDLLSAMRTLSVFRAY